MTGSFGNYLWRAGQCDDFSNMSPGRETGAPWASEAPWATLIGVVDGATPTPGSRGASTILPT
jgi:hypothetical protein